MRIEILHVAGCPGLVPAIQLVQEVLTAEGLEARIETVLVTDANLSSVRGFAGSPTILLNGRDVEPGASPALSLSCRLYQNPQAPGLPRRELVAASIQKARADESR
jgi:hypothetical protein